MSCVHLTWSWGVKRCLLPTTHPTARQRLFYSLDLFPHFIPSIHLAYDKKLHYKQYVGRGCGPSASLQPCRAAGGPRQPVFLVGCRSWQQPLAQLAFPLGKAGTEGAVPLGMAFLGGCLKCQMHWDALITGTTH